MKAIIEDEVLFQRTDEDSMIVATTSVALNKSNILNISLLTEKLNKVESEKRKLQDEITNLKKKMKIRKKVDDHLIPLRESILEEQEILHDAKVKCFAEVHKMEYIIKALEKNLENASQVNLNMESVWTKIVELLEWRKKEKNVPNGHLIISYDIILHTLDTNECQELDSKFKENVK